jgi:hypothetical protein
MRNSKHRVLGEAELAQANARADASSAFGADDWDDAIEASAADCAELCDSLPRVADDDID